MKRTILYLLLIATLGTALMFPVLAFAQTAPATAATGQSTGGIIATAAGWITGALPAMKILDAVLEFAIIPIASWMLALSGYMLDFSINFSLNFAAQVSAAGSSIVLGWTIMRDLFNMFFIFALIYIAITTMLGETGFLGKTTLKNVIIAAILINFSFFFTTVFIDAGNIVGGWLYQGIETTLASSGATSPTGSPSISAGLSGALGVFDLYNPAQSIGLLDGVSANTITFQLESAYIRLGLIIFATYIFGYVTVLFFARTVSLLFMLVMSPIGFAGWILPMTKPMADEWKEEMEKNILLAPVFLLYLYVIIAFISSNIFGAPNLGATTTNALDPSAYFKYFLLAAMLLYALRKAKKFSGQLGDMAGKFANQLGQTLAGVAMGGAGLVGQLTIGAAASRVAGSRRLNEVVAAGGVTGAIAGATQKRLQGVGDYHFNIPAEVLGKEMGIKPGKGYNSLVKDNLEAQKKATEALATTPKDRAPIKDRLDAAERAAYASHGTYGARYDAAHGAMNTAEAAYKADPGNKEKAKEYKEAEKLVDTFKTLIEKDPKFDKNEEILKKQEEQLEDINITLLAAKAGGDKKLQDDRQKEFDAMQAAMAQGRAIRNAQKGPGIGIAKVLSGQGVKSNVPFLKSISEDNAKIISKVAQILTGGAAGGFLGTSISQGASQQYLKDSGKILKGMREAAEDKKGKKEKDISKLFAEIAADEAGGAAPAGSTAPSSAPETPPPSGAPEH